VDAAIGAKLTVEVLTGITIFAAVTKVGSAASLNDTTEVLTGITIFAAVTKVGSAASLNDTTDEDTNAIRHLHY
jgi:hypothetical protein